MTDKSVLDRVAALLVSVWEEQCAQYDRSEAAYLAEDEDEEIAAHLRYDELEKREERLMQIAAKWAARNDT